MDCHATKLRRRRFVYLFTFILALASQSLADNTTAPAPAVPPANAITRAFRNDATLNAVSFINQTSGWAVGDRGVIWHTEDAGTTWRQQQSPVSSALNDVFFIDALRGWAAGGQCQPLTSATRGV